MPFVEHTKKMTEDRRSRVLQCGPPNSRKTSNFLTWPKPILFINAPGEKGQDTIPTDDPEIKSFSWELDKANFSSSQAAGDLDKLITDILVGRYGSPQTVHFEGLHKVSELFVDVASDGAFSAGDDFEPRLYGRARNMLLDLITRLSLSAVPHVGFSVWDDYEKDRQKKSTEDASNYAKTVGEHVYPALFGKMAKRIMGEFSVVCYNTQRRNAKGEVEWVWRIRPGGEVWGAGIKLPPAVAAKLPEFIPMGFDSLKSVLYPNP